MSTQPELTQEQKKLKYQIEQWREAALRSADKLHNERLADIDHDYRYRMVDAGLEAHIEPVANAPTREPVEYIHFTDEMITQVYEKHRPLMDALADRDEDAYYASKFQAQPDAQAKVAELTAALEGARTLSREMVGILKQNGLEIDAYLGLVYAGTETPYDADARAGEAVVSDSREEAEKLLRVRHWSNSLFGKRHVIVIMDDVEHLLSAGKEWDRSLAVGSDIQRLTYDELAELFGVQPPT